MTIIKAAQRRSIQVAAKHLKEGGIIIYPTETSYGVGALISDALALEKVRELKGRGDRPFLSLVSSLQMAKKYANLGAIGLALAKEYWPGPLTIVAESKKRVALHAFSKTSGIALRYSAHPFGTALVKAVGVPIISTSANLSGKQPCYSITSLIKQFGKRKLQNVLIIDGGRLPRKKPTTVVQIKNGRFKVLRQGTVTI